MNKIKTLLVDDSELDNFYFEQLVKIRELPLEIVVCRNAILAIEWLEEVKSADFPQLVISDINMPFMDGFEFADIYQKDFLALNPKVAFFVISSSIQLRDKDRAEQHPLIRGFIEKPFFKKHFEELIAPALNYANENLA